MSTFGTIGAFISIAVLTLLAALPWGLPTEDRFFLPLLPVVAIHYWALRRPEVLPEWFVFLAGLLLDVFTHGPLGYWPLVYLVAYALGVLGSEAGRASVYVAPRAVCRLACRRRGAELGRRLDLLPRDCGLGALRSRRRLCGRLRRFVIIPLLHLIDRAFRRCATRLS